VNRAVWDSGLAQGVEHCGIVGSGIAESVEHYGIVG